MNNTLQKHLEGSDRGLIQLFSGPLSEKAVETSENTQTV
jgi:hypothetical protein